jgi:hypothetical protein
LECRYSVRLALEAKKPKQRELRNVSWTRLILGPWRAADERASCPPHAPTPHRIGVGQEILDQDFEERSHGPMMAVVPDGRSILALFGRPSLNAVVSAVMHAGRNAQPPVNDRWGLSG